MPGLFDQLLMQLMQAQAQPTGLLGNMDTPTMSDESQYPMMPGQQFAANTLSNSEIQRRSFRQLDELRRKMGVQDSTPSGRATDEVLKAIEEALRYAPK